MEGKTKFRLSQQQPPFLLPKGYADYVQDRSFSSPGLFGEIRKFDSPDFSKSIVIKRYTNPYRSQAHSQHILREINLLRTLNHPNILKLLGCYTADESQHTPDYKRTEDAAARIETIYHITEHSGCGLYDIIEHGQYSMRDVRDWMRQLLCGLQYLHSNEVIYGNLRSSKICINAKKELTLLGFGRARVIEGNMTSATMGTNEYFAIEQLIHWEKPHGEKVDIWSASVLLCELITGQLPFTGSGPQVLRKQIQYCGPIDTDVLDKMTSESEQIGKYLWKLCAGASRRDFVEVLREQLLPGRAISVEDILSNEHLLRDFIDNTLQFNPERRMSAHLASIHPFVVDDEECEQQ